MDLCSTNKLSDIKFPSMSRNFSEFASWNDVQSALSTRQPLNAPNIMPHGFAQNNPPQPTTLGADPFHAFGFDPTSLDKEGGEMARDDFGMINSGGTWDTSWQSLMDQLGVAEVHV